MNIGRLITQLSVLLSFFGGFFDSSSLFASTGNCAHVALAECLSVELGYRLEASELVPHFPAAYRGDSPVPVHVLIDVARKFGVRLSLEMLNPSVPAKVWEGSILLLFAKTPNAHFVLCKDVASQEVMIHDSLLSLTEKHFSTRQLPAIWDGTALVVSRRNPVLTIEALFLSAIFATVIVVLFGWWREKKKLVIGGLLPILAVTIVQGCNSKQNDSVKSEPNLHFDRNVIVLQQSVVEGSPYQMKVSLVRSRGATTGASIRKISTSCKCLTVTEEKWPKLLPGDSIDISILVNSLGKDVVAGDVIVETVEGEIASVNITGIVTTQFRASSSLVVHNFRPNEASDGLISIVRRKEKGTPMSKPEITAVDDLGIELQLIDVVDEDIGRSPVGGDSVRESHQWKYHIGADARNSKIDLPYESVSIEFRVQHR